MHRHFNSGRSPCRHFSLSSSPSRRWSRHRRCLFRREGLREATGPEPRAGRAVVRTLVTSACSVMDACLTPTASVLTRKGGGATSSARFAAAGVFQVLELVCHALQLSAADLAVGRPDRIGRLTVNNICVFLLLARGRSAAAVSSARLSAVAVRRGRWPAHTRAGCIRCPRPVRARG
jgi:hypothetical protein